MRSKPSKRRSAATAGAIRSASSGKDAIAAAPCPGGAIVTGSVPVAGERMRGAPGVGDGGTGR